MYNCVILNMPEGTKIDTLIAEHVLKMPYDVFPFSTDLKAAWTIFDKLIEDNFLPVVQYGGSGWECRFRRLGFPDVTLPESLRGIRCVAETPELAICRVALLYHNAYSPIGED